MAATAPLDLADAILQFLRQSPAAMEYGDTYDPGTGLGVPKFFGDFASAADPPYLVIGEPGENRTYFTRGPDNRIPYISEGSLGLSTFAADRYQARALGLLLGTYLNDQPLAWLGVSNMMLLRFMTGLFVPTTAVGPGVPTMFHFVSVFNFGYQGVE